ncbi:hypothetical protein Syun_030098 [Stephania yunnanensis]|uniref:Uncharacterized protein n=1 Tax=Stephania yunnanensis TaxID=152371 RepID=A0AAP0HHW7_9MAGN
MTRPNNTSFRPCQVTGNLRIRVRSRGSFTWITIISDKTESSRSKGPCLGDFFVSSWT